MIYGASLERKPCGRPCGDKESTALGMFLPDLCLRIALNGNNLGTGRAIFEERIESLPICFGRSWLSARIRIAKPNCASYQTGPIQAILFKKRTV
jgi:hypothetical protein